MPLSMKFVYEFSSITHSIEIPWKIDFMDGLNIIINTSVVEFIPSKFTN